MGLLILLALVSLALRAIPVLFGMARGILLAFAIIILFGGIHEYFYPDPPEPVVEYVASEYQPGGVVKTRTIEDIDQQIHSFSNEYRRGEITEQEYRHGIAVLEELKRNGGTFVDYFAPQTSGNASNYQPTCTPQQALDAYNAGFAATQVK